MSFSSFKSEILLFKSLTKQEIIFNKLILNDMYLFVKKDIKKDINFLNLLKEEINKEDNNKPNQINKEAANIPKIRIRTLELNNAKLKYVEKRDKKDFHFDIKDFTYRAKNLSTYDSFADHNLNIKINKNTIIKVNGKINLLAFKIKGKLFISNLNPYDYLSYKNDLFNFNMKESILNLNTLFNISYNKSFLLNLNKLNLDLNNFKIEKNSKNIFALKEFKINDLNLNLKNKTISSNYISFSNLDINKYETLDLDTLIKKNGNPKDIKSKTRQKHDKNNNTNNSLWNIHINNISLLKSSINYIDKKQKIKVENINSYINNFSLEKNLIKINKLTYLNDNISIEDKINKEKNDLLKLKIDVNKILIEKDNINIFSLNIKNKSLINQNSLKKIKVKDFNLIINNINYSKNKLAIKKTTINKLKILILMKKISKKTSKTIDIKSEKTSNKKDKIALDIGNVFLNNSDITFIDKNVKEEFKSNINNLNIYISHINSSSNKKSKIKINANIQKYSYLKVKGYVNILNFKKYTDISVLIKNIALKDFTAYSEKFISRKINTGKINLDLKYKIKNSKLYGKNDIKIKKVELNSDIKEELLLPISLAITLLEDSNSIIDLNLPISGNINETSFSISKVLLSTFNNLILKTAASPFNILASILGLKKDEINSIDFMAGSSIILQDQKETLDKLSKVLREKNKLRLSFNPTYNKILDTKELQNIIFNKKDTTFIKSGEKEYIVFLEDYYNKKSEILKLRAYYIKDNVLNTKSYINKLKFRIKSSIKISEIDLSNLAKLRAKNIYKYFQEHKINNIEINDKIINHKNNHSLIKTKFQIKIKK